MTIVEQNKHLMQKNTVELVNKELFGRCYLKINFIPLKASSTLLVNWIIKLVWLDFSWHVLF